MTKQDIGAYYVSLPFGERTMFLDVIEQSGVGYKADHWRRVFLCWADGRTRGKPLTDYQQERIETLINNDKWRKDYSNMLDALKKRKKLTKLTVS